MSLSLLTSFSLLPSLSLSPLSLPPSLLLSPSGDNCHAISSHAPPHNRSLQKRPHPSAEGLMASCPAETIVNVCCSEMLSFGLICYAEAKGGKVFKREILVNGIKNCRKRLENVLGFGKRSLTCSVPMVSVN